MRPNRLCEKIELYHDGELGPEETLEIVGHLASCRECMETLAELKALETMLAPARGANASALCPTVMARVRALQPQSRFDPFSPAVGKRPP